MMMMMKKMVLPYGHDVLDLSIMVIIIDKSRFFKFIK